MALTEKAQQTLNDYLGGMSGTDSYLKNYKNVKKRETAAASFSRIYNSEEGQAYVKGIMEELKSEAVADVEEILTFLSSVMRGELSDQKVVEDNQGDKMMIEVPVPTSDRIKAAELLGKYYGLWKDKVDVNATQSVVIVDDIAA